MDYIYDDSEIEMSESLNDLGAEDQYRDSDTEDEIPDPNLSPIALYQDTDKLPEPLEKGHFQEGIIYALTLKNDRAVINLGMIILVTDSSFLFRVFTAKGTSRKTYHDGAADKEFAFDQIQRLAPRRELMQPKHPKKARVER